ncbi:MAG: 4Fe-4S dicluster domain-containing protein [Hyphomicrobiales bacterium]
MKFGNRHVLVCSCEKTMELDGKFIANALGADGNPKLCSHLCRTETPQFADALKSGEDLLVACTQEAPLFRELADEARHSGDIRFTNIRERAGWSDESAKAGPKIAALLAEAVLDIAQPGAVPISSDGVCLVYGAGQEALDVARKLAPKLNVSVVLCDGDDVIPPTVADVPIHKGEIAGASGHFGAFEIVVNGYAPAVASSRSAMEFVMARDGASSTCAIIIDISGRDPMFAGHERRDGYFRAEPGNRAAIAEIMFEAADLVGEFEKPLYVSYAPGICAHSRSNQPGCNRCIDVCPAAAITSAGDTVEIDHIVCGGCGACSSACPSGAVSYAMPRRDDLTERVQKLLQVYLGAGGKSPILLVHDERHGADMIAAIARFGKGLPAHVIPFAVNEVSQIGHDWMAGAFASGASSLVFLCDPKKLSELDALKFQAKLTTAMIDAMGYGDENRIAFAEDADPDMVESQLWELAPASAPNPQGFAASNNKRETARTALGLLNEAGKSRQEQIALPAGAPYGRIEVDQAGCTMCLSCVSACPMGAISDNPDRPQISFTELACVQCGLCRNTCPESVITLEPRFNFSNEALSPIILNEEEPFECISCGKPFGTKSAIERISAELAGKHSMFQTAEAADLIKMCDLCRIEHQANSANDPFAAGERPKVVRTEDYLEEEKAAKAGGARTKLTSDDFLINGDE